MTMKRSLNKISPTSNWSSTVALGVSKCPFATNRWKSGDGPSFKNVCGAAIAFSVSLLSKCHLSVRLYH